jgi:cobalt-zinc-cadmium efflux system membrane fusion protein
MSSYKKSEEEVNKISHNHNEAIVGSIIDGRVHDIFVNQGDYVKKGQVLAKIMNFQIGEIKGEYIKSKVEFAFTKENLERAKNLFENNISSKKSLLLAQMEYEKAEAEFLSASEKLSSIGLTDKDAYGVSSNENLPIIDIRAPISGKIVERNVNIGEYIESTKNLFKIIDISKFWVDAVVYEKDISKIKLGQKVEIIINAYPDNVYNGEIIYIGDVINSETKTLTIRTTVNNPKNILKPNMFSTVKIYYREERRLLAINY